MSGYWVMLKISLPLAPLSKITTPLLFPKLDKGTGVIRILHNAAYWVRPKLSLLARPKPNFRLIRHRIFLIFRVTVYAVSLLYFTGNRRQTAGYTFLLRTRKGIKYILRAASEEDRMDWVQTLQTVSETSSMVMTE